MCHRSFFYYCLPDIRYNTPLRQWITDWEREMKGRMMSMSIRRKFTPEMIPTLSKIYNKCLIASCFPASWKSFSVDLVESSDSSNYCPIILLSHFGKVLESLINFELAKHLTSHGLISDIKYIAFVFVSPGQPPMS